MQRFTEVPTEHTQPEVVIQECYSFASDALNNTNSLVILLNQMKLKKYYDYFIQCKTYLLTKGIISILAANRTE